MRRLCTAALAALLAAPVLHAQPELSNRIASLAAKLLAGSRREKGEASLDDLFRLQIAARRYEAARKTLAELRAMRARRGSGPSPFSTLQYETYAEARAIQARNHSAFAPAFAAAFREVIGALDDRTSAVQAQWVFGTSVVRLENELEAALRRHEDTAPSERDRIDVVRKFVALEAYRDFSPLLREAFDADDQRRYIVQKNVLVKTGDGVAICALIFRPRVPSRLPALLDFTIYSGPYLPMFEARRSAAHGYVGIEGFTRGKACSPNEPIPIEHDGSDAAALIEWISKQPWSDGRVGMFGGSYEGFTQWAAAKHMPRALKAMMPSVTFAPGIDFPMDGNVFMNYAYPWPFYTTDAKTLDDKTYDDKQRWDRLNRSWYLSGKPYRDLDRIDGTTNPIFDRWLEHPSYDAYWRSVIPYGAEFKRIDIPVLTTTGYYDSGQIGALYYFRQHTRYRPHAEHYLVIGPYDHIGGQRGTITPIGTRTTVLRNYRLDDAAQIDIGRLRYQWFDYVLRGAPKPPILKDKVNYEVMGANVWKHASSLAAMHDRTLTLYLDAARQKNGYALTPRRPRTGSVEQTVDLADRSDVDQLARGEIIDQAGDDWNIVDRAPRLGHAIQFISEPFQSPIEISGLFSGSLDCVVNKKDFDFSVTLFQLTPAGQYMQLSYYWSRASFVRDRRHRVLLVPGKAVHLPFESGRLTSVRFEPGSRLVVVVGVIKQPSEQINYGTGKDVSDESIADAREPLRIRWLPDSSIDIPLGR